jgi:hypothetical protein
MFLPNHSGDHSAGKVFKTPSNDYDIANKKYVDEISCGWTETATTTSTDLDVDVFARSNTAVALTINAAASSTSNSKLIELRSSSDTVVSSIDALGQFAIGPYVAAYPLTVYRSTGVCTVFYRGGSTSTGAARFLIGESTGAQRYGGFTRFSEAFGTVAKRGVMALYNQNKPILLSTGESYSGALKYDFYMVADGWIGVGTGTPEGALDVSSTTGGFIVPRMTTSQRTALTAVDGMIVYDTDVDAFYFYEAGAWVTGSGLV